MVGGRGRLNSGVSKQATINALATSYVEAARPPTVPRRSPEGGQLTTDQPYFGAGDVVNVVNTSFSYTDVLPIRSMTVTFPTPKAPRFRLLMSWEIDMDWSMIDPWIPPGTASDRRPQDDAAWSEGGLLRWAVRHHRRFNRPDGPTARASLFGATWATTEPLTTGMYRGIGGGRLHLKNGDFNSDGHPTPGVFAGLNVAPAPSGSVIWTPVTVTGNPALTIELGHQSMIEFSNDPALFIFNRVRLIRGGHSTTGTLPFSLTANTMYVIKWLDTAAGTWMKIWVYGDLEPVGWLVTDLTPTTVVGRFAFVQDANSATQIESYFDDLDLCDLNGCTAVQFDDFNRVNNYGLGDAVNGWRWAARTPPSATPSRGATGASLSPRSGPARAPGTPTTRTTRPVCRPSSGSTSSR
jgi:hypothetical protein